MRKKMVEYGRCESIGSRPFWRSRMRSRLMPVLINVFLFVILLTGDSTRVNAQQLRDTFRRVQPSVVVIRTVEKTVAPLAQQGMVSVPTLASGVLI